MKPEVIVVLVLPVFTIAVMVLVMWVISRASGWRDLAASFPAVPPEPGAARGLTSLWFLTIGGYNNCIVWNADDHYLHLRVMRPLGVFHRPMSIPWEVIEVGRGAWPPGWTTITIGDRTYRTPGAVVERAPESSRAAAQGR